jgi:phosphatidylinositol-3-phosphatase
MLLYRGNGTEMLSALQVCALSAAVALAGCGGSSKPSGTPTPAPSTSAVSADHVVLVVLENHSFNTVIGSASMPYFNSLASQRALATNYFADAHPSISNYFMLTTGHTETNDNNFAGTITDDNVARAFSAAGKSWRAYMEALPHDGYTGGDVFPYLKHHDPFVYFSDVLDSTAMTSNVVSLSQFTADVSANTLPSFALVVPDAENDAHSCLGNAASCPDADKLVRADNWLRNNIDPLLHSQAFSNTVLIVTWDEGDDTDMANGGGQVATVIAGGNVKTGFRSVTFYQHESTLRLIMELLQVNDFPGASMSAPEMNEFFQ